MCGAPIEYVWGAQVPASNTQIENHESLGCYGKEKQGNMIFWAWDFGTTGYTSANAYWVRPHFSIYFGALTLMKAWSYHFITYTYNMCFK